MRHSDYKDLFFTIVARHKELKQSGVATSQMHLSANPLQQQLDLSEFYSSLKNKRGTQVVLQSFHTEYEGDAGPNRSRWLHGALLVLEYVDKDNWQLQGEVYDRTERQAEEILAAAMRQVNETYKYLMEAKHLEGEKIGPVNGFHGTRISFSIKQLAVASLHYKPDLFE